MLFSSIVFIWIFLPLVLAGNLLLQKLGGNRAANALLLVASLFFYAWGEPFYVLLMLFSILSNYLFGRLIATGHERMRIVLVLAVVVNLSLLGYFKYAGMAVRTWNRLTGMKVPSPEVALPIGISFFTFQALSYVIDVYRGKCSAQKNILKVALYISFFPQLIAGPIVQFKDIEEQIDHRIMTRTEFAQGVRRFLYGFSKKILIANSLASAVDTIYGLDLMRVDGKLAWIASFLYTFQVYYDFSGYSDMAIGLGKMFGFTFRENFVYPYTAASVREFWKRWHISLSSWFREYLYFPLGGSKKGTWRTYRNLFIVFFLTGLWHGASWNFVVWGLYHGCFMIIERAGLGKVLERRRILSVIYTFLVANIGWVFFRVDRIGDALAYLRRMFLPWLYSGETVFWQEYVNPHVLLVLVAAVIGMGFIQRYDIGRIRRATFSVPELICLTLMFFLSLASLAANTYNPFIYFRF